MISQLSQYMISYLNYYDIIYDICISYVMSYMISYTISDSNRPGGSFPGSDGQEDRRDSIVPLVAR